MCNPVTHSVCFNNITGNAANHLATVVFEHAAMADFCGIPLRDNSIMELNLLQKGVGVPGAIVISKLLPSAVALTSLKCAAISNPDQQSFLSTSHIAFVFIITT